MSGLFVQAKEKTNLLMKYLSFLIAAADLLRFLWAISTWKFGMDIVRKEILGLYALRRVGGRHIEGS